MAKRFLFESKGESLQPYPQFLRRILLCALLSLSLAAVTIATGAVAYHCLENLPWIDALLNSVLVMCGLGLTDALHTSAGKLFTSVFALMSAIVYYSMLAILFTPFLHRLLHHFHLDADE